MTDEITKVELEAMIAVQEKAATQMEKVASALNIIVENQKIIIHSVAEVVATLRTCDVCKDRIKQVKADVSVTKWIISSLAGVLALGYLILKIAGH